MTAVEEEDPEAVSCPQRKFSLAEQREIKKKYEKLIHKIANKYARDLKGLGVSAVDAGDLFAVGLRATFYAIETYDAGRGAKESSWVAMLARRAIQREVYRALGLKTKDIATLRAENPSAEDAARLAEVLHAQFLPLGGDGGTRSYQSAMGEDRAKGADRSGRVQTAPPLTYEPGWLDVYEAELRWLHREIHKLLTPMERKVLETVFDESGAETRLAEKLGYSKQWINLVKQDAIAKLRRAANRTLFRK